MKQTEQQHDARVFRLMGDKNHKGVQCPGVTQRVGECPAPGNNPLSLGKRREQMTG